MKTIKKLTIIYFVLALVWSCAKEDQTVYKVMDGQTYGAVLREIEKISPAFNVFDTSSTFDLIIEEQDEKDGGLFEKVVIYETFYDNNDDGVDNSKPETVVKEIPASAFSKDEFNLPRGQVTISLGEALNAAGLDTGEYFGGDSFDFRLELVLTDGRKFSSYNATGDIQGQYFNSPFLYKVPLVCPPVPGDYVVEMFDSYGDGWQGGKIIVTIDGVSQELTIGNYWEGVPEADYTHKIVTVTVPQNFTSLKWEWVPDLYPECSFKIYGPNTGDVIYEAGPDPAPASGEFVPNYCNE